MQAMAEDIERLLVLTFDDWLGERRYRSMAT